MTQKVFFGCLLPFVFGFLLMLIFLSVAHADVLQKKVAVLPTARIPLEETASTTGEYIAIPAGWNKHVVRIMAENTGGSTPTLDVVIQDCFEDKVPSSCKTLYEPDQCTTGSCWTDGEKVFQYSADRAAKPFLRALTTLGGTNPQYKVKVQLWLGK